MLARLSLRARLLLGVIALAAVGLVAADLVTYSKLSSFLIDRTDTSLNAAHQAVEGALTGPSGGNPGPGGPDGGHRRVDGRCAGRLHRAAAGSNGTVIARELRTSVLGWRAAAGAEAAGDDSLCRRRRLDATASRTSPSRRSPAAAAGACARRSSRRRRTAILIVAASLGDVDSTLHQLLLIELLVTGLVLAAIGGLGFWVIRLSLRPLDAIETTAAAIAAGDLTQRVELADEQTEVGRLGLALNAMLTQIEIAFKASEASERKLRRFVADASHELRTPLAAVRAYAELFTRGAAERPDDLARSMSGITREAERMSVLVDDLLLLARLDEGRPLEQEPVELADVVGEAVDAARAVEPNRPIEVTLEPATVIGDRDRLRQIVDNLLSNIRAHAGPDTPVQVTLSRANGTAEITVVDSGPGLTEEQASHVFERFYRADGSRARANGGVGLGLAIVAAVAQAHGGDVSAHSAPGEGATFSIALPLAE